MSLSIGAFNTACDPAGLRISIFIERTSVRPTAGHIKKPTLRLPPPESKLQSAALVVQTPGVPLDSSRHCSGHGGSGGKKLEKRPPVT